MRDSKGITHNAFFTRSQNPADTKPMWGYEKGSNMRVYESKSGNGKETVLVLMKER